MLRNPILRTLPLLVLAFLLSAFAPPATVVDGGDDNAKVMIDGREVKPEGTLTFRRDDTVELEATGLKPNSNVEIKVKKGGISWAKQNYRADKRGMVRGIFDIPDKKITITALISYRDARNRSQEAKVKIKVQ